ncbi:hypothetical protein UB43_20665 [Pseudomonas sp. 21]|nr:hypothetical protein UB43_20665 [Pseudomonas sp. 21]
MFNGDTLLGTVDADANGQWHINLPAGSADGQYKIYAVAVNDAGMQSTKAGPFIFNVDTIPPEPLKPEQWEIIDDVGSHTGPIQGGEVTDDDLPTVKNTEGQTLPPGFIVTVYDDGRAIGSTTVNPDGTWTLNVSAPQGPHDISITVTDFAKNEGAKSNHITFSTDIDPNAPSITGVFNDEGTGLVLIDRFGYTNDATPEVHGKAKANSQIEVYSDQDALVGSTVADGNGDWTLDVTPWLTALTP